MDDVRTYIMSIVAAAIISSIAISITSKMGVIAQIIKLLSGLFLSITVISPLITLPTFDLAQYYSSIEADASGIIAESQEIVDAETARIIKAQSEEYILNKATSLGANLEVEVTLADTSPKIPVSVTVTGDISPYLKRQLQQVIVNDLGIQEEDQIWM